MPGHLIEYYAQNNLCAQVQRQIGGHLNITVLSFKLLIYSINTLNYFPNIKDRRKIKSLHKGVLLN